MSKKQETVKIEAGIYRHYKKNQEYEVLGVAKNTETNEKLVVYKNTELGEIWARPLNNFLEEVLDNEKKIKRFSFVGPAKSQNEELEDRCMRALADYQNLLRQTAKEKEEFARYASEQVILEILPAYDNLKISLKHIDESVEKNGWAEGIKYVVKQFASALESVGVKEIVTEGEKFDHNTMEAVSEEETSDKDKNEIVAKELTAGYSLKGKVIRAARVAVYKLK